MLDWNLLMTGAFLEIRSGIDSEIVPLGDDNITVGRALGNDLTIDDGRVSRLHARIQRLGSAWAIRDLGSRNGTHVNGERLLSERALQDHDEIRIGGTTIRFREASADPTAVTLPHSLLAIQDQLVTNAFLREGDFWCLTYGGTIIRLKDSKGLRDIARLLATPGSEVAALDLASREHPGTGGRAGMIAELGLGVEADAGEALDAEARVQYRARLADLEEEITEAAADNDLERASRAREEREFLLSELAAAVGLGGRARKMLDPAERARKAATGRVRDAISHIEMAHPQLGRHLRRSVRTGSFCVYDPPEPTDWQL
jgi:pSer/pThr/pTyr-binding forkhead associated (FHA) protein